MLLARLRSAAMEGWGSGVGLESGRAGVDDTAKTMMAGDAVSGPVVRRPKSAVAPTMGGASRDAVGAEEQELCDEAKVPVEGHLGRRFVQWACVEAMSQVVAGTMWYFKVEILNPHP